MSKKRLAEKEKAGDNLYRLATAILKYNGFPSTPSPKPNQTPSAKPVKAKKREEARHRLVLPLDIHHPRHHLRLHHPVVGSLWPTYQVSAFCTRGTYSMDYSSAILHRPAAIHDTWWQPALVRARQMQQRSRNHISSWALPTASLLFCRWLRDWER